MVLVRGALSHGPVLLATDDQVAAELAARAIGVLQADPGTVHGGPWEHPFVQRATELELGLSHPDALRLTARWHGDDGDADQGELIAVAARAAELLGVRAVLPGNMSADSRIGRAVLR
jgi:hypothetical protein